MNFPHQKHKIKPYYKDYLFSYIFNTDKLKELIQIENKVIFNAYVEKNLTKGTAIEEVIYYHNPNQERRINRRQGLEKTKIEGFCSNPEFTDLDQSGDGRNRKIGIPGLSAFAESVFAISPTH